MTRAPKRSAPKWNAARAARLAERIAHLPRPLLLAFDVDGTLAPIVDDPAGARVPRANLRMLDALRGVPRIHVALVTGRDARSLARVARVAGVWRVVEHGRIVVAPGARLRRQPLTATERARLRAFERWARARAQPLGAVIEHKPESRSVHVREFARRSPTRAKRLLAEAVRIARDVGLMPRLGRGFVEAEVRSADKADAVAQIARTARARAVLYIGDDRTDANAIRLAGKLGGLGIFVRSDERPRAPCGASVVLDGPDEVALVLQHLVGRLTR